MTTTPAEPVQPSDGEGVQRIEDEDWAQHHPDAPETEPSDEDDGQEVPTGSLD